MCVVTSQAVVVGVTTTQAILVGGIVLVRGTSNSAAVSGGRHHIGSIVDTKITPDVELLYDNLNLILIDSRVVERIRRVISIHDEYLLIIIILI